MITTTTLVSIAQGILKRHFHILYFQGTVKSVNRKNACSVGTSDQTFIRGVNIKFKYFNSLPKTEQQIDPKTIIHYRVSGGISIFSGQYGNIKLCRA